MDRLEHEALVVAIPCLSDFFQEVLMGILQAVLLLLEGQHVLIKFDGFVEYR